MTNRIGGIVDCIAELMKELYGNTLLRGQETFVRDKGITELHNLNLSYPKISHIL